jgi:glycosyltransferase involved in cell wall biosynthesis
MNDRDKPVKVLVGMPFAAPLGGAERHLDLVAREGAHHGIDMHVVFFTHGPMEEKLRALGVRTSVVDLGRFRDLATGRRAIRRLRAIVARERPDVVFSWLPRSQLYLNPAARLAGVPVERIAWWQHHAPTGDLLERAATLVPAGAVVCASDTVVAAQQRLRPKRPIKLVHYGIEAPDPAPAAALEELRAELGIPAGRSVVGLPGRLVEWKGQDRFLDAVALLRERGADVHALVVGGPGHGGETDWHRGLRSRAERAPLAGAVTFTGHVDEPIPYIQLMDVMVNASEPEPFGLTLVEAQALGVPVVAVDIGGPREIVIHGESGWLVPTGAPEDLADGIAAVLADAGLRDRITDAGRRSYEQRFTADAGVARFADAMREIASR